MKKTLLKTHSSTCRLGSTQHILGRVEPRLTVHWKLDVWLRLLSSGALAALAPREHSFILSFSFFSLHLIFLTGSSWIHFTTSFQRSRGIHFSCLMFVFGKKVAGTKQCLKFWNENDKITTVYKNTSTPVWRSLRCCTNVERLGCKGSFEISWSNFRRQNFAGKLHQRLCNIWGCVISCCSYFPSLWTDL